MPGFAIGDNILPVFAQDPSATVDPLRSYRWRIATITQPGGQAIYTSSEVIPVELTLPSKSFEQLEISGVSQKYKFAKSVSFDDVTVTLYDLVGLQKKFEDWMDKVWTKDAGLQTDYKGTAEFHLIDGQGGEKPLVSFKLINTWPKKLNHSQLSMSTNEFKLLTITFAYDWYEFTSNAKSQ